LASSVIKYTSQHAYTRFRRKNDEKFSRYLWREWRHLFEYIKKKLRTNLTDWGIMSIFVMFDKYFGLLS
jgi:hypothetical protein